MGADRSIFKTLKKHLIENIYPIAAVKNLTIFLHLVPNFMFDSLEG